MADPAKTRGTQQRQGQANALKDIVTTKADTAPPATREETIGQFLEKHKGELAKALPQHCTIDRLNRIFMGAVNRTPRLGECTLPSLIGGIVVSSQLGLEVNTPLGHAYLIPYKRSVKTAEGWKDIMEAVFQLGYQGILDLAYRTGMFKMLYCESVYENDTFSYCYGLHKDLKHTPANKDRGNLIGVYAVFHLHNGGWDFKYWTVDQILDHAKKYSQSWDERESKFRKGSAWADNFDGMAKVPVIKDLLKLAPKSIEFQKQLTFDGSSKVEILPDMTEAKDAAVIDISLPVPGCLHPEDRREGDACTICGEVVGAVAEPPKGEAKEAEKETTQKG